MTSKKIKFGLSHYDKPNPKIIRKVALAVKSFCMALAGTELFIGSPKIGMYIMVVGFLANEVFNFFADEEDNYYDNHSGGNDKLSESETA